MKELKTNYFNIMVNTHCTLNENGVNFTKIILGLELNVSKNKNCILQR